LEPVVQILLPARNNAPVKSSRGDVMSWLARDGSEGQQLFAGIDTRRASRVRAAVCSFSPLLSSLLKAMTGHIFVKSSRQYDSVGMTELAFVKSPQIVATGVVTASKLGVIEDWLPCRKALVSHEYEPI